MTGANLELAVANGDFASINDLGTFIFELFSDRAVTVSISAVSDAHWKLEVLLPSGQHWEEIEKTILSSYQDTIPPFTVDLIPESSWLSAPQLQLEPVQAGCFILHDKMHPVAQTPGTLPVEIDAGLAFGTGHHPTTRSCLEEIGNIFSLDKINTMLDLGCGSAILAIAAAKLSQKKILASDNDPVATQVARNNIQINGVANLVEVITASGFDHAEISRRKPFDLIVANILADTLEAMAQEMQAHTRPSGGYVILSGILREQETKVLNAYECCGFLIEKIRPHDGWVTCTLRT